MSGGRPRALPGLPAAGRSQSGLTRTAHPTGPPTPTRDTTSRLRVTGCGRLYGFHSDERFYALDTRRDSDYQELARVARQVATTRV